MAGLCVPLSTLRPRPRGQTRMTRGQCGSLLLHCNGLAPSTPCRSPGAPTVVLNGARGRFPRTGAASAALFNVCRADALLVESEAKRRLADEYDAVQERGEVARQGQSFGRGEGPDPRRRGVDLQGARYGSE